MEPGEEHPSDVGFQSAFARALAQASVRRSKSHQAEPTAVQPEDPDEENVNQQLKEECERLMEENRRLKASAVLSSHLNIDHEQRAEVTLLQSKVNTLAWQLSQSESRRRMVCSVAEQVATFLERVSKTLTANSNSPEAKRSNSARCRVPRSRSTHSGDIRDSLEHEFTPRTSLQRSNSQMQHTDSEYSYTSRRSSSVSIESAENDKLGQQAHRLARTLKSMLSSQEPPIMSNESPSSSFSELLRMTSKRRLNYELPERPQIIQQEPSVPSRPPLPSDVTYISPLMQQDSTSTCSSNSSSSSSPTLKARDSDESGFSSIGSFQEVGLPSPNEIIPRHARCRSTPLINNRNHSARHLNFYNENSQIGSASLEITTLEKLKVLWV
ncbi:histone acetyltransferase KAT6A-like [Neocloeon triangulifer]|uniref:histone acetyltransferase KAT6A-like n=1 Tax=Neocloeon triangulifer TaxID=2078957 RepID=UPI00286F5B69|nr:histone acetyltransferase KAT6A-like [Neocloeon triangulifer]